MQCLSVIFEHPAFFYHHLTKTTNFCSSSSSSFNLLLQWIVCLHLPIRVRVLLYFTSLFLFLNITRQFLTQTPFQLPNADNSAPLSNDFQYCGDRRVKASHPKDTWCRPLIHQHRPTEGKRVSRWDENTLEDAGVLLLLQLSLLFCSC